MSGRLDGKVVLVTGAARGQGRSHAVRLAREGADIIAVDLCDDIGSVPYALAAKSDLEETARQIEALDRRVVTATADVRDLTALTAAVGAGVAELGHLDVVVANAGILSLGTTEEITEQSWRDMIDVNLTGVFFTVQAALPHVRAGGKGGSLVLTSSITAIRPLAHLPHYVAAKGGVGGLMRALAQELSAERIRVNTVNPSIVDTPMIQNAAMYSLFMPDVAEPSTEQIAAAYSTLNPIPTPWVDVSDVSDAVVYLASDESRFVTGLELKIDAGYSVA